MKRTLLATLLSTIALAAAPEVVFQSSGTALVVRVDNAGELAAATLGAEVGAATSIVIKGNLNAADLAALGNDGGVKQHLQSLDLTDTYFASFDGAMTQLAWCDGLKRVLLPADERMTTIPDCCMGYGFQNLEEVVIPGNYTAIGREAFSGYRPRFTTVALPDGVTTIGEGAFRNAHLTSLRLPSALERIEKEAFKDCQWLTSLTLPEGLRYIGDRAFNVCNRLRDIYCLGADAPQLGTDVFHPNTLGNVAGNNAYAVADGGQARREFYWESSMQNSDHIGACVLHIPAQLTPAQLAAYTNPDKHRLDGGSFALVSPSGSLRWPNIGQLTANYQEETGWRQFGLVEYTTQSEVVTVTTIKDDTWYTVVLPFCLTKDQIEATFGAGTELCLFKDAVVTDDATGKHVMFDFTQDAFGHQTDPVAQVLEADRPYMIHPATAPAAGQTQVAFRIVGACCPDEAALAARTPQRVMHNGFTFQGNYLGDRKIPRGWYFLGVYQGVCKYYCQTKDPARPQSAWRPFTCAIEPPAGWESAKAMSICFADETGAGAATAVHAAQADPQPSGAWHDLNGRRVEPTGHPHVGIYIVDSKKVAR